MYNPLLDTEIRVLSWYEIIEGINANIERAARKGDREKAFKLIAEIEIYDPETAFYWKESGYALFAKGEQPKMGLRQLAYKPQSSSDTLGFEPISIL